MADDPKWMQHAGEKMREKGTVGSFTRAAHRAGKSVSQFAKMPHTGKMAQKANFARNAAKARH